MKKRSDSDRKNIGEERRQPGSRRSFFRRSAVLLWALMAAVMLSAGSCNDRDEPQRVTGQSGSPDNVSTGGPGGDSGSGSGGVIGEQNVNVDMSSTAAALLSLDYWAMEGSNWVLRFEKDGIGAWYRSGDGTKGYAGVFEWKKDADGNVSYTGYGAGPNERYQIDDESGKYQVYNVESSQVSGVISKVEKETVDGKPLYSFTMDVPFWGSVVTGRFVSDAQGRSAVPNGIFEAVREVGGPSQENFLKNSSWTLGSKQPGLAAEKMYEFEHVDRLTIKDNEFRIESTGMRKGEFLCNVIVKGTVEYGGHMGNDAVLKAEPYQWVGAEGNIMADCPARNLFCRVMFTESGPQLAVRTSNDYYESRSLCDILVGKRYKGYATSADDNRYWITENGDWLVHFENNGIGWWYYAKKGEEGNAGVFLWDEDEDGGINYRGYGSWPYTEIQAGAVGAGWGVDIGECSCRGTLQSVQRDGDGTLASFEMKVPQRYLTTECRFVKAPEDQKKLPDNLCELFRTHDGLSQGDFYKNSTWVYSGEQLGEDRSKVEECFVIDKLRMSDQGNGSALYRMDVRILRKGTTVYQTTLTGHMSYGDYMTNYTNIWVSSFDYSYEYGGETVTGEFTGKALYTVLVFTDDGPCLAIRTMSDATKVRTRKEIMVPQ